MKKKRLVWLHSHTLLSTGGTRFIHEVLKRLAIKYNVLLVVEKTSTEWKKNFEKDNVKVAEISDKTSTSIIYWAILPYYLIKNFFEIKKIVKSEDIVISSMFPFNFLGSQISKNHIYYCFEPFAFFYDEPLMKESGKIKYLLLKILKYIYSPIDKTGTRNANALLAINPSVGKYIKKIYGVNANEFTYLGVDTKHFSPKKVKKTKQTVFYHSTDYTSLKGTQYLIEILPKLKNYSDQFKILISDSISNSSLKQYFTTKIIENNLENSIQFVGHLSYKDLPDYYSKSDCYLFLGNPLSQGASAASLSVLEAQSCSLPVLRSIGNNDEIVNKQTGFFVDPTNSEELAKKMIFLIKNKKYLFKLSKNCRKHITSKYTWDNVTKVFINSIESIHNS